MNEIVKSDAQKVQTTDLTPIEIALGVDDQGRTTAKKLYAFLQLRPGDYARWYNDKIVKNEFATEGADYEVFRTNEENPLGGRPSQDYKLTATFAKKLAMGTHNERGEQAKNYFIKVEDKLKQVAIDASQLSPETQLLLKLSQSIAQNEIQQKRLSKEIKDTREEVQSIKDIIIINPKAAWRDKTNKILDTIGYATKKYKDIKEEAYLALESRARCDLKQRLKNLKGRALLQGMAPSKVNLLNNLDVIENDSKLREIYIAIIKEMAIKNNVNVKDVV